MIESQKKNSKRHNRLFNIRYIIPSFMEGGAFEPNMFVKFYFLISALTAICRLPKDSLTLNNVQCIIPRSVNNCYAYNLNLSKCVINVCERTLL